jgi:hypothetical protein
MAQSNVAMSIFWGKNYLGQRDKFGDDDTENKDITIVIGE